MVLPIPYSITPFLLIFGLAYAIVQAFLVEGLSEKDNEWFARIRGGCGAVRELFSSVTESLNAFASEYNDVYLEKKEVEKEE